MADRNNIMDMFWGKQTEVESELERRRRHERRNAEALALDAAAYQRMPEDLCSRAKEWGVSALMDAVWLNAYRCGYLQHGRDAALRNSEANAEDRDER